MTVPESREAAAPAGLTRYSIGRHQHLFAAWAASRAASVKGCRFTVEQGRTMLEAAGFDAGFSSPDLLPDPEAIDGWHRARRNAVIEAAAVLDASLSHGVAAKLLNVYLKSRFVCGGHQDNIRVRHLHPPVDDVLLKALAVTDVGGYAAEWRRARRLRWSKLTSEHYETLIGLVRQSLNGEPLWMIEEHWRGNR